jgi:hypothetical protein
MYYTEAMTKKVWQADMARFNAALAPYVFSDEFGSWIAADAPATLTEAYSKLTSVGYWNGWIA